MRRWVLWPKSHLPQTKDAGYFEKNGLDVDMQFSLPKMASVKIGAGRLISKDVGALTQLGAANHAARAFLKHPTGCAAAEAILVQLTAAAGLRLPWWRGVAAWAGKKALTANDARLREWLSQHGC